VKKTVIEKKYVGTYLYNVGIILEVKTEHISSQRSLSNLPGIEIGAINFGRIVGGRRGGRWL